MPGKMSVAERNPLAKGCEGCYFLSNYFGCCNYLIYTEKRRPCPGGEGCTVKTTQTPESWEKVILWDTVLAQKLYSQGATDAEISKACHAPIGQVKAFRSRHLGPANHKEGEKVGGMKVKWDTQKGLELWLQGETLAEISKKVGASQAAVSRYALRNWTDMEGQRVKQRGPGKHSWNTQKGYELWCNGLTDTQIAADVGVHPETIRTYRIKNWGESNAKRQMSWDTEKGLELFRQGMTPYKIARELGTCKQNVMSYARKHWEGER